MKLDAFQDYITNHAPVLFFELESDGRIVEVNQYTKELLGDQLKDTMFVDILIDFDSIFELDYFLADSSKIHLLSISTIAGSPQTFRFLFVRNKTGICVFGHKDLSEEAMMQTQILSLNQELGNISRQLHKKNAELKEALEHVKTLQGIIPICMHCHKIRNDEQIWEKLENYLSDHTDAMLSHGICPDCIKKYYPDPDKD